MVEGTNGWFGAQSTNVAVNVTTGAAESNVYYIHTDHLDTPRLVANSSGTTVWSWEQQEPFGVNVPDENPSALGQFEFALRFPGQYADKETILYYNYFRDYDATIGRYVQSDPIGLSGGMNTYTYALGNPVARVDPLGLASCEQGDSAQSAPQPLQLAFVQCVLTHTIESSRSPMIVSCRYRCFGVMQPVIVISTTGVCPANPLGKGAL